MSDEIPTMVERGVTAEPPAQRTPDGPARAGGGSALGKHPISKRELHSLEVDAEGAASRIWIRNIQTNMDSKYSN